MKESNHGRKKQIWQPRKNKPRRKNERKKKKKESLLFFKNLNQHA